MTRRSPAYRTTLFTILAIHSIHAGAAARNTTLRGSYDNSRHVFLDTKQGHVAFLGGSITEMDGYRPMVCNSLQRRFPETDFTFTNAGIASTCSTTGAMRLTRDILSKGPVDLLFIEFAVNDTGDAAHPRREAIRGMEGIIRQARRHNPRVDIVITHFVSPDMRDQILAGRTPQAIAAHEEVAEHYDISTIHLAQEVTTRIQEGTLTWKQFGGTHPAPAGNRICADMIEQLLRDAWKTPDSQTSAPIPHAVRSALDHGAYAHGRLIAPQGAQAVTGWVLQVPDWKTLPGGKRGRFVKQQLLCGSRPGAELNLTFQGRTVGAYLLAGPDAGTLESRVDDADFQTLDTYHHFSKGLHYPRTIIFATDLGQGDHTLTLRIAESTSSSGHAIRIMYFVAN